MIDPEEEYSIVSDTTEDECMEKWEGVKWEKYDDDSGLGDCYSAIDFDAWSKKYEEEK